MPRTAGLQSKGSRFVVLASMCVVVATLYFAQEVLIPLALAVLFCFLLTPVVSWLERWRIGRVPAVIIVVVAGCTLVALLAWVVTLQVLNLAGRLPEYEDNIVAKVDAFRNRFSGGKGGIAYDLNHAVQEVTAATTRPAATPATTQATTQPTTQTSNEAEAEKSAAQDPSAATRIAPPPDPVQQLVHDPMGSAAQQIAKGPPKQGPLIGTSKDNPIWAVALEEPATPLNLLGSYLGTILSPLGTAGLVLVFVIFIMIQREDLRDRMLRLIGRHELHVSTTALDDAASRISRYMMAQAIVNGSYGIAVGLGLWLIGYFVGDKPFPSFVLWALLCSLLRFIPYIGPWIAAAFPIVLSLAVYQGFGVFFWTAGMFVVIELLSNNLMEPWLYGTSTGMSTIAVLVSAVFWTWLWGPVGLLLATPLTVCLVVIGKYVPQLQFLDILLGDEPVLDPPERVYQRLLAADQEEATDLLREYLKEKPLEQVYDDVLMPALSLAELDRHKGRLDEPRQQFVHTAVRDIVEELGDEWRLRLDRNSADAMKAAAAATVEAARGSDAIGPGSATELAKPGERAAEYAAKRNGGNGSAAGKPQGAAANGADAVEYADLPGHAVRVPKGCTVNVVCLPAHDAADELTALMFAQILEFRGYCAYPVSVTRLASEMVAAVEKKNAHVTVVCAMPPAAVAHSRYLCKRLHARFPDLKMVVGLWTLRGDVKKAKDRVTCETTVQVVTTFEQATEQVHQMAQPTILAETERLAAAERD
ncbi:MAG TPA: AI-2E family transporter [Tepidisphaeraceae bacterium]|nr:AI-2E family transporter [Tepidisphaeraceae bacterium]